MAVYTNEDGALATPRAHRPNGSSRKLRIQALGFLFVALGAGLAAAWLIMNYLAHRPGTGPSVPLVQVAVAAEDLPLATTLKPDMLTIVRWPKDAAPGGTFPDPGQLTGRVTATSFIKGEPLVESRLAAAGSGMGMAAIIPAEMRAMTVRVNEVVGVSGFIHPGDLVDVVTTMQASRDGHSTADLEYRSKIVLQSIKVLAVGEDLVTRNAKPVKVPVVTLMVTPEQSEQLALASSHGDLQLTMRSQSDTKTVTTPGISPAELLSLGGAAVARAPSTDTSARHHRSPKPNIAASSTPAQADVVEVLRGDKFEERKLRSKESQ